MCVRCPDYAPVIFEHPLYGTLVVAAMADVDYETTDNVDLAIEALCARPDGSGLVLVPSCVLMQGMLMRIERLH